MTRQNEMTKSVSGLLSAILLFAFAAPAFAHSYKFGDVEVGHLWGPPPSAASATEANVFGPIFNSGASADRLVSVTSPLAQKVEFRTGADEKAGTAIDLAPGKPVSLASWGVHLRLVGLKHPLKEKEWVPIHLVFEKAGAHDAKVLIESQPGH